MKRWTDSEISILLEKHADLDVYKLSNLLGRSPQSIRHKLSGLGIHCQNKVQREQTPVNHDFFKVWTPEMSYVLGYWFADGHITRGTNHTYSFKITSKDSDHLVLIRKLLKSEHRIYNRGDGSYQLAIGSKTIWEDVQLLGGQPAKSLIAQFPHVPMFYACDFIRGYFDGDGSIQVRATGYPIAKFLGTKEFLSGLQQHLPVQTYLYQRRAGNQYQLEFRGENAQKVLHWMYHNAMYYLKRKYLLYKKAMKWRYPHLA